jgi:hypothetical protein
MKMTDETTPETTPADVYTEKAIDALIEVLKAATSPVLMETQLILLRRLALAGDVVPSRIPAPLNITEVGGYLNYLETLQETEMRRQVLASILGVAGDPPLGTSLTGPALFFVSRTNDRPAGNQQATYPLGFSMRNDFATAFDAILAQIHAAGCQVPLLTPLRILPPAPSTTPPTDLLRFLGRTLDLAPTAALIDPDADPLAVAHPDSGSVLEVVARQLDASAPDAGDVTSASWVAIQCDNTACTESSDDRLYLPLTPIFNAAGWYQPAPTTPTSLTSPGTWARWTNITGLIPGVTRFGDELSLLYAPAEIAASALRDLSLWTWDGEVFSPLSA